MKVGGELDGGMEREIQALHASGLFSLHSFLNTITGTTLLIVPTLMPLPTALWSSPIPTE